jgi:hypothetical protein
MKGELQERIKIDLGRFSTGSTTVEYTPYYDMQNYDSIDFIVSALPRLDSSGDLGGIDYQKMTIAAYQATSATGGGSSAISSATAIIGKDSATGISTSAKCREGYIFFSTIADDAALEVTVGTAVFTGATSDSAAMFFECAASEAATVACQGFVNCFNDATNNTATALTANWKAATLAAGVPWVRILPKDPDGTHLLTLGSTGSSQIGVAGAVTAHIRVEKQYLSKRYVALGCNSTENAFPYCVHVMREAVNAPATSVAVVSKTIGQSTSK